MSEDHWPWPYEAKNSPSHLDVEAVAVDGVHRVVECSQKRRLSERARAVLRQRDEGGVGGEVLAAARSTTRAEHLRGQGGRGRAGLGVEAGRGGRGAGKGAGERVARRHTPHRHRSQRPFGEAGAAADVERLQVRAPLAERQYAA